MEDIDLYGDGLATELNVSQPITPMQHLPPKMAAIPPPIIKTEPIKSEPVRMPPSMPPAIPYSRPHMPMGQAPAPAVKLEPTSAPSSMKLPVAGVPGVTYVTQDTFAQQNRHQYIDPSDPKSKTVYVGNLTWWTTDQDLINACASLNVRDINNVKFFENRANGQSKGYCAIDVASLNSAKTLMHELRNVTIHNEHPYVAIASKTPLYYFETALGIKNDDKTTKKGPGGFDGPPPPAMGGMPPGLPPMPLPGMPHPGMPHPGMHGLPPPPPGMLGPPRMHRPPGCPLPPPMPLPPPPMGVSPMLPPPPDLSRPPTLPMQFMPMCTVPGMMPGMLPPGPIPQAPGAAHVNPAFLPSSTPKMEDVMTSHEKNDMIDKNHQVCKTAILRAYESCDTRDYDQAEGTVAAALKIIKMSAVSEDARSKSFITDLEECLAYVQKRQKKSKSQSTRSGSHRRPERSDREKKDSRRRSRSQDSGRENRERKREKRENRDTRGERESSRTHERAKNYDDYKEMRRRELI